MITKFYWNWVKLYEIGKTQWKNQVHKIHIIRNDVLYIRYCSIRYQYLYLVKYFNACDNQFWSLKSLLYKLCLLNFNVDVWLLPIKKKSSGENWIETRNLWTIVKCINSLFLSACVNRAKILLEPEWNISFPL